MTVFLYVVIRFATPIIIFFVPSEFTCQNIWACMISSQNWCEHSQVQNSVGSIIYDFRVQALLAYFQLRYSFRNRFIFLEMVEILLGVFLQKTFDPHEISRL